MSKQERERVLPELRFPEFNEHEAWACVNANELFQQVSNKNYKSDLPILAITQEYGAIPRELIDYNVSVSDKSIQSYKVVDVGDFIISLRSFQGGIEYSTYKGVCSPAYVILRKKEDVNEQFFKQYFKTTAFICDLTRNLEGLRDGKMVSYKQFSEVPLPFTSPEEQKKIADFLSSLDKLITAENQKLTALKNHKKGLMQQLFPINGESLPTLRFPEFQDEVGWKENSIDALIEEGVIFPPKDGNHGNIHPKSSDYVNSGIPFIMASDIQYGKIDLVGCSKISKEQADKLQKGFAIEGDVLLTHKGTVGEIAIVNKIECPYLMLTPQVTYYRIKDNDKLSNRFLGYCFTSDPFQKRLAIASGGGTRSYIGIIEQRKLKVTFPVNLEEQIKVADCLSALDKLITSERKKIEYLKTHKKGVMQQLFPVMGEVGA